MRTTIAKAMQNSDEWVISLDYIDSHGACTRRIVSPIRFLAGDRFLALCLCREGPRQFSLSRCRNVRICQSADFVMPVPVLTLSMEDATPALAGCV